MSETSLAYEAEYNLRDRHPDWEQHWAWWREASEKTRESLTCELDIAYGDGPNMTLDLFPATKPGAPIMIFIHGGYWRAMDKIDHSFPAGPIVAAGAALVSLNYALAPSVTVDEITEQCRTAVAWIARNAARANGDAARLFVTGHSAGGHLTAEMASTDWTERGLPADTVKAAMPISGLFDLAPLRETTINNEARLDAEGARRNSPLHHIPDRAPPMIITVGAGETREFLRQSRDYAYALRAAGHSAGLVEVADKHHYNVVSELGSADSHLTQTALNLMGLTPR